MQEAIFVMWPKTKKQEIIYQTPVETSWLFVSL